MHLRSTSPNGGSPPGRNCGQLIIAVILPCQGYLNGTPTVKDARETGTDTCEIGIMCFLNTLAVRPSKGLNPTTADVWGGTAPAVSFLSFRYSVWKTQKNQKHSFQEYPMNPFPDFI